MRVALWVNACACILLAACATSPGDKQKASITQLLSDVSSQFPTEEDLGPPQPVTTQVDASIPERFRKNIEFAQILGLSLFHEDRAAWVATDAIVAKGVLARHKHHATGWLSEQQNSAGTEWNVVFTGENDGQRFAYADVNVEFLTGEPRISVNENNPPRELSGIETVMAHARDNVKKLDWLRCAKTYNTSTQILIDEGKKYAVVRLMPGQTDKNILPRGGFHRFRLPMFANGKVEHFAQTKTCLVTDITQLEPDETFGMTLTTSPTPTEFDVFESLSYGNPHYVISKEGSWRIENGKIYWLGDSMEKTP